MGEDRDLALKDERAIRCLCGSLMARISEEGIELKCKRCKRVHIIPSFSIEDEGLRREK